MDNSIDAEYFGSPNFLAARGALAAHPLGRAYPGDTGARLHAWLLERRIDRAKELLVGTTMHLDEIAREVSFAGKQGLIGAFKRVVGATLQACRNATLT